MDKISSRKRETAPVVLSIKNNTEPFTLSDVLKNVNVLKIKNCPKLVIDPSFDADEALHTIIIQGCRVSSIPPNKIFRNVKQLTMNDCNLSDLKNLEGTKSQILDLSGNCIYSLDDLKVLYYVRKLYISDNPIQRISIDLPALRGIDISRTGINDISNLSDCIYLYKLIAESCSIRELPKLGLLSQLKLVDTKIKTNIVLDIRRTHPYSNSMFHVRPSTKPLTVYFDNDWRGIVEIHADSIKSYTVRDSIIVIEYHSASTVTYSLRSEITSFDIFLERRGKNIKPNDKGSYWTSDRITSLKIYIPYFREVNPKSDWIF